MGQERDSKMWPETSGDPRFLGVMREILAQIIAAQTVEDVSEDRHAEITPVLRSALFQQLETVVGTGVLIEVGQVQDLQGSWQFVVTLYGPVSDGTLQGLRDKHGMFAGFPVEYDRGLSNFSEDNA